MTTCRKQIAIEVRHARTHETVTMGERLEQVGTSIATYVAVSIVGATAWVVRRVLTNQKQIEMLQREIHHRDQQRTEDRALLGETRDDVKEIRRVLMDRGN